MQTELWMIRQTIHSLIHSWARGSSHIWPGSCCICAVRTL